MARRPSQNARTAPPAPAAGPARDRLSCRAIVDAAMTLADAQGVDALSMRTLASSLSVQAMSLYSHFTNKDDLLTALTRRVISEMPLPNPRHAPRRRLADLARAYRDIGHRHPNIFPLVVLRPQPLDAALVTTECALRAFLDAGLPARRAISAQRTLLAFVRGFTLWEIGGFATGRRDGPGGRPRASVIAEVRALDPERFPTVSRLVDRMIAFEPDEEFDRALRIVLDALLEGV